MKLEVHGTCKLYFMVTGVVAVPLRSMRYKALSVTTTLMDNHVVACQESRFVRLVWLNKKAHNRHLNLAPLSFAQRFSTICDVGICYKLSCLPRMPFSFIEVYEFWGGWKESPKTTYLWHILGNNRWVPYVDFQSFHHDGRLVPLVSTKAGS